MGRSLALRPQPRPDFRDHLPSIVRARIRSSTSWPGLAGPRPGGSTNLWVRIMDVPRALEARSYSAPIDLVFEVHDPMGDIDGRYHLMASTEGAECSRTDAEASITLDAEDLGAIYMGRSRLRALSRVGRLQGDPDSLAAADAAFTWDPQPWCPEVF